MLGVNAISESPLSSSGTSRFSNIYVIEDMSMATFEVVVDEDGVLITNLISVGGYARGFKDWEKISTGTDTHWTKIRAAGNTQWGSIENAQSVDWHDIQNIKRNKLWP